MKFFGFALAAGLIAVPAARAAETCTTQSQMPPADLTALAAAATALATEIQADDEAGLRQHTIAEFQQNFSGIASAVASTATRIKGATPQVDGLYLLDASSLKAVNGVNPDAQFFCALHGSENRAPSEV